MPDPALTFELSMTSVLGTFIAILLAITAYFLKQSLGTLKDVQTQQSILAQRVATIEGRCEAHSNDFHRRKDD